jgi:disulfide bond formation protein DsbB
MLSKLETIGSSFWYWLTLVVLGLSMQGLALTYQYVLEYLPCVLCIHVRIWVLGFILLALLALLVRKYRPLLVMAHVLNTVIMVGLLERAWMLLGTERGTVEGSCGMDSGLPGWFALDAWFPRLFKVWEPCGYTPELLPGITMAVALVVFSATMLPVSVTLTLAALFGRKTVQL